MATKKKEAKPGPSATAAPKGDRLTVGGDGGDEAKPGPSATAAPKGTVAKAKSAAAKAAGTVAKVMSGAVEAVEERVVKPVAKAVGAAPPPKPKTARYVRPGQGPKPDAAPAALPPRSTKASGKMMSRGMALPPKDQPAGNPGRGSAG